MLRNQERNNNLVIDATFNDQVKEPMTEKAQFERLTDVALLKTSLDLVTQSLDSELKARGVEVDFSSHIKDAQNRLKFVAKGIASLAAAREAESQQQVPEPLLLAQSIQFQLAPLAMGSQFSGLYVFAVETATVGLEALQKKYAVEGDWVPATISESDFLFIVDYTSILVNLSNLSSDHWPKAKDKLAEMMDGLRLA